MHHGHPRHKGCATTTTSMLDCGGIYDRRAHTTTGNTSIRGGGRVRARANARQCASGNRAAGTAAEGVPPTRARGYAAVSAAVCSATSAAGRRPAPRAASPRRGRLALGRYMYAPHTCTQPPREDVSTQVSAALACERCSPRRAYLSTRTAQPRVRRRFARLRLQLSSCRDLCAPRRAV